MAGSGCEMKALSAQIDKILNSLGTCAEDVAISLGEKGIQGVRHTVRILNPVIRYVQGELQADLLGMDLIRPGTLRIHNGKQDEVPLPPPVVDFLAAFNQGMFPDLEQPVKRGK
jgi:hypothetical protein